MSRGERCLFVLLELLTITVLRMKEYEREKRLLKREKRIGAKQSKEDLIA
jgi:hypothetical protein